MEDNLNFSIYDELGNETVCRIICTFMNSSNKKHYIVYTNDTYDRNEKLNFYAAIFDPNDESVFDEITSREELDIIHNYLNEMGE